MDKETEIYILNVLRRGTITWSGRTECLNRNRRKKLVGRFKNGKNKYVYERQCDGCGQWTELKDDLLEVDHIVEVGPFEGDWNATVKRMYCEQSNLQALCKECHDRKTARFVASLIFKRKNKEVIELVQNPLEYL